MDDKRTATSLSMIIRVSSHNVLLNHAVAQSDGERRAALVLPAFRCPSTADCVAFSAFRSLTSAVAIADGGATWRNASLLLNVSGPTCQGSIARLNDGSIVVAAPHYPRWRYKRPALSLTFPWPFTAFPLTFRCLSLTFSLPFPDLSPLFHCLSTAFS